MLTRSISTLAEATCREEIRLSTPNDQVVDNNDGTVSDLATGLMWKQCSEGQSDDDSCSGRAESYTWQIASRIPEDLNTSGGYAGYTDWRLPNVKELRSIVENSCFDSSINLTRFPNTPRVRYW